MLVSSVPFVGEARGGTTAMGDDGLKLAHDPQADQRGVGDPREAFRLDGEDSRQATQ